MLHVVPDPSLGRFERLIAPPVQRYRGLRINTIEVFERAVAIRWHHIKPEPDYDGKRQWPSDEREALVSDLALDSELIDDVGTEYGPSTGETSWTRWEDGSIVGHGIEVRFPGAAAAAKRLTYRQGELELLIPIETMPELTSTEAARQQIVVSLHDILFAYSRRSELSRYLREELAAMTAIGVVDPEEGAFWLRQLERVNEFAESDRSRRRKPVSWRANT